MTRFVAIILAVCLFKVTVGLEAICQWLVRTFASDWLDVPAPTVKPMTLAAIQEHRQRLRATAPRTFTKFAGDARPARRAVPVMR